MKDDKNSKFEELKIFLGVKTDRELAAKLGIRHQSVTSAKARKQIPMKWLRRLPPEAEVSHLFRTSLTTPLTNNDKAYSTQHIGHVAVVSGSFVSVLVKSGSVPQIGSFVRISAGIDLLGVIYKMGPDDMGDLSRSYTKIVSVKLLGDIKNSKYHEGVSTYPATENGVYLISGQELSCLLQNDNVSTTIEVGYLSEYKNISARLDINQIIDGHCAIFGMNEAGKTLTTARIIQSCKQLGEKSPHFLVIDPFGEYSKLLKESSKIFRINPDIEEGVEPLFIPHWALRSEEWFAITPFRHVDRRTRDFIRRLIFKCRHNNLRYAQSENSSLVKPEIEAIPFHVDDLLYNLDFNSLHIIEQSDKASDPAMPKYDSPANNEFDLHYQIQLMSSIARDKTYNFIFHPWEWESESNGKAQKTVEDLLRFWMESEKDKPIRIFDISRAPAQIRNDIIRALIRLLYGYVSELRYAGTPPFIIVLEDIINSQNKFERHVINRILQEGKNFQLGAIVVSQSPRTIVGDILHRFSTLITMRLPSEADISHITENASQDVKTFSTILPTLRNGEAIITGKAVKFPLRTQFG